MTYAISSRAGSRVNRLSPIPSLPDVDCVVVNRDGGEALFEAIHSLRNQSEIDLTLVVVDNASKPEERERLAREAPEARVVTFSRNLGFAAAANEGIVRTRAPFVLLVNNDAVLAPDYTARLAARLELDERLAAVQGLVLQKGTSRIDSAGFRWTERGEAVPVLRGEEASRITSVTFEVPGVSATAALFRRDALADVARHGHFFDDRFFAYYEDVDLSLRLARAGWRFACDPQAVAWHEGSRTGRRTPFRRAVWTARNRWRTLLGNFDRSFLKRNLPRLLRADLAHAKSLGAKGTLLPLLVWPLLPALAFRARGKKRLLPGWPSAEPEDARPSAAAAGS
jgi:GT2 family glycosyltransferase